MKAIIGGIVAIAVIAAIVGGGSQDDPAATAATRSLESGTAKMEQQLEKEKAKTAKLDEQLKAEQEKPKQEKMSATERALKETGQGDSSDKETVPNIVGMDHQLAQDTLQASGFYLLDEVDCSGQDRMLLWDRNWTVQDQEPAAGTKLSIDGTVTLCSVKDGE
jgi:beta-lactam-binding protein with PASTA domain